MHLENVFRKSNVEDDTKYNLFNFLTKLFYYFCISPYKICRTKDDSFYIKTWFPQAILSCTVTCIGLFCYIWEAFQIIPVNNTDVKNPVSYFMSAVVLINIFHRLVIYKVVWIDRGRHINLLNLLNLSVKLDHRRKRIVRSVNQLVILLGLINLAVLIYNIKISINLPLRGMPKDLFIETLFLKTLTWIFIQIGRIHSSIVVGFGSVYFAIKSYIIFCVSESFSNLLQRNPMKNKSNIIWMDIENKYKLLCQLCKAFNLVYGHLVTCFVVVVVLYNAMEFEGSMGAETQDWGNRLGFCLYLLLTFMFYYFAMNINQNVGMLKDWLGIRENRELVLNCRELTFLLDQLNCNVVSIKASNVFPITYGFVATMITTMTTYFVIFVQTRTS